MALKVVLKQGDRLLVGSSKMLIASKGDTTIIIEGDVPIMRESDSLAYDDADTAAKLFYFHIQQFYLTGDVSQAPRIRQAADAIGSEASGEILLLLDGGEIFRALRKAKALAGI